MQVNNKQRTSSKKRSDRIKFAVIAILIIALIATLTLSILSKGFKDWSLFKSKAADQSEEQVEEDTFIINPISSEFLKLVPIAYASEASPAAELTHTIRLTATVLPEGAPQAVTWSVRFKNPSSAWATGKSVNDYVTLDTQPDPGGLSTNSSPIVDVTALQGFEEQIIIDVVSQLNDQAKASCTVDYANRYEYQNEGDSFAYDSATGKASIKFAESTYGTIVGDAVLSVKVDFSGFVTTVKSQISRQFVSQGGGTEYSDLITLGTYEKSTFTFAKNENHVLTFEWDGLKDLPISYQYLYNLNGKGVMVYHALTVNDNSEENWLKFLFGENAATIKALDNAVYNKIATAVNNAIKENLPKTSADASDTTGVYIQLDFESAATTINKTIQWGFSRNIMPYRVTGVEVSQGNIVF